MRRKLLAFLAVVALGVAATLLARHSYRPAPAGADGRAAPGTLAADLRLPTLDGTERALSDWRGKLLLVNFWATWCTPCLHEIPMLVRFQQQYGDRGLQVIGPAVDDPDPVRTAVVPLRINYPVMIGDGAADGMAALGDTLGALPYSVLISSDGEVLYRKHGEFSQEELQALVEKNLP